MSRWTEILSARGPLITVISTVLICGFLATSLISYQSSKRSLRETLVENELPLTSNNIYSEIQRDLLQPVFVSSLMANDTFVKDWLLDGERDPRSMLRYLNEIRRKYGVFTSFLVSDRTRNYYHFSGISQVVSEEDPRDAWYFRVRDMQDPHEINVDLNAEQSNTLTIFINHKVFGYDGAYLAATGVGLEFDTLAKIVDRYREYFDRHVYFIDESGKIMVRSAGAYITGDSILTAPGIDAVANELMTADHGSFEYEVDGDTMLISTRRIPELGWRVLVQQREATALKGIRQTLISNLVMGAIVIAITLTLIILAVNVFHNRMAAMAVTDRLTGVGNRSGFDLHLEQALKRRRRDNNPMSIILMDIDHFKRVNDTLGHLEGDRVIKQITQLVASQIREADTLCRWGGEELIVLADDCDRENAVYLAEKIRNAVAQSNFVRGSDLPPITLSAGVTDVRESDDGNSVLKRVDAALYQAKNDGRNTVRRA